MSELESLKQENETLRKMVFSLTAQLDAAPLSTFTSENYFTVKGVAKGVEAGFASIATDGCVLWVSEPSQDKKIKEPIKASVLLSGPVFKNLCDWVINRQASIVSTQKAVAEMDELMNKKKK